jgi:outer membrane protein assembly factor BamB
MGSANDDLARFYAVGDVPAERARDTPDDVSDSSAISSNGTVYVGGANGRLYAFKP